MFDNTDMMRMAKALTRHAGARQLAVARNVANADTPGYRARDAAPFDPAADSGGLPLRATRTGHVAQGGAPRVRLVDAGGEAAPNGNTVSLEDELVRGATVKRQHDLALSVYQSGLRLMRTATGRR